MPSEAVTPPGRSGILISFAAWSSFGDEPGDTAKAQPSLSMSAIWAGVITVPTPTMAPFTSAMMARMDSMAAPVRRVISRTGRPPLTSARASGTASATRSITITGTTGAALRMASMPACKSLVIMQPRKLMRPGRRGPQDSGRP